MNIHPDDLLWLAIIMSAAFMGITALSIAPLIKILRDQAEFIQKIINTLPKGH
jgi:hypothetical protein